MYYSKVRKELRKIFEKLGIKCENGEKNG